MMNITPQLAQGAQLIESYGAGGFRIAGVRYETGVLVTPQTTRAWDVTDAAALTLESLAPLLDTKPEVLLIGTGARHEMIPPSLKAALKARHIACDTMDTGAACRTFNILLGEGRKVSVALILLPQG